MRIERRGRKKEEVAFRCFWISLPFLFGRRSIENKENRGAPFFPLSTPTPPSLSTKTTGAPLSSRGLLTITSSTDPSPSWPSRPRGKKSFLFLVLPSALFLSSSFAPPFSSQLTTALSRFFFFNVKTTTTTITARAAPSPSPTSRRSAPTSPTSTPRPRKPSRPPPEASTGPLARASAPPRSTSPPTPSRPPRSRDCRPRSTPSGPSWSTTSSRCWRGARG